MSKLFRDVHSIDRETDTRVRKYLCKCTHTRHVRRARTYTPDVFYSRVRASNREAEFSKAGIENFRNFRNL